VCFIFNPGVALDQWDLMCTHTFKGDGSQALVCRSWADTLALSPKIKLLTHNPKVRFWLLSSQARFIFCFYKENPGMMK
jgi:hypothetical protein